MDPNGIEKFIPRLRVQTQVFQICICYMYIYKLTSNWKNATDLHVSFRWDQFSQVQQGALATNFK